MAVYEVNTAPKSPESGASEGKKMTDKAEQRMISQVLDTLVEDQCNIDKKGVNVHSHTPITFWH